MRWGTSVAFVVAAACTACSGGNGHPIDASHDGIPVGCGDGVRISPEQCDGTDLGSATCGTALAPGWIGVVSCTASCEINVANCSTPATTYNSETDSGKWSTFDLTTLFPGAKGFIGSAFDGRYMYFSPNSNGAADGIVAQYDTTQGGFGSSQSWKTFDVSTVDSNAKGFQGAAFDGRYLYLIPYNNGAIYSGTIARFDTQAAGGFGDAGSWLTFDISTVDPNARGYVRAAFDGRYLYLSPHYNGVYHGIVARYDTQGAGGFANASSWSTFDISTVNPGAKGFLGIDFDGRYVYFAPYYDGTVYDGLAVRYDTQNNDGFAASSSWATFDMQSIDPDAVGFRGMVFDGQYIYFAQYYDGVATMPVYNGIIMRYDTHQAFTSPARMAPVRHRRGRQPQRQGLHRRHVRRSLHLLRAVLRQPHLRRRRAALRHPGTVQRRRLVDDVRHPDRESRLALLPGCRVRRPVRLLRPELHG